jgi:FkbM family methyltransferase
LLGSLRRSLARLRQDPEERRLAKWPRFTATETTFLGRRVQVPDATTFLASRREIFEKEVYRFTTTQPAPRVIDCGANIGMATIHCKVQHPAARVTAFEPDPVLFAALERNVAAFGLADVELRREAAWVHTGTLRFHQEGGHSGRIAIEGDGRIIEVRCTRLRDLLGERIDFLKVDVEGAELELLEHCHDRLGNVERLFVEYHSRADRPQRLDELLRLLSGAGFRYDIKEEFSAPHPFVEIRTQVGFDLQLSISCHRPR